MNKRLSNDPIGNRWIGVCLLMCWLFLNPGSAHGQFESTDTIDVEVMMLLIDVLDIDDATQSMTVDFALRMKWKDTTWTGGRRTFNESDLGEIWYPELQVINGQGVEPQIRKGIMEVFPDGQHLFRQRFFGKISSQIHSETFPFDKHRFSVKCIVINPEPIRFREEQGIDAEGPAYSILDWHLSDEVFRIREHNGLGRTFSAFERSFEGSRFLAFYFWKIFVPLTLVVIMSWTVFWVDPKHTEQLTVAVTAMLTIIALQFTLQDLTPDISYLTRLDVYLLSCNILVLLALLESVMTSKLLSSGNRSLALAVDRRSRWIFPLAYIICCVLALTW